MVEQHYAEIGLVEKVREALRQSGFDPDRMQQSELEKFDQFHVGGLEATQVLAKLAGIQATDAVVDLGSGIGGPSRYLASTIGCHVTGIDLTEEYCKVAKMMAEATGLSHLVRYERGDATQTPFEDASFNVAWTQHASMNIEDKAGLYREAHRLLKDQGRLAIHDIVRGTGEVKYPVPWARGPQISFLVTEQEMNQTVMAAGFQKVIVEDVSVEGLQAIRQVAARLPGQGFGLGTLMGPEFGGMVKNLIANLESGACRVIHALYVR